MKKITTVIFDLDGTLLDTLEDLTDAVNHAMEMCGFPRRNIAEVKSFVGNGIKKLLERAVPAGTSVEWTDKAYEYFKSYYDLHCMDKTRPYKGISELLFALKQRGYRMAVVSNKADAVVRKLSSHFFKENIEVAIGATEELAKKPAPDMVNKALDKLKSSREEAVYIGDSDVDLATAVNAVLPCITVLWGFRDRGFLQKMGAERFAEKAEDILSILDAF